jgi:hypothetical protein
MSPQYLSTVPPSPITPGTDPISVCYDSGGQAHFPVTVTITWYPSGKTSTLVFTEDSCQPADVPEGTYAAIGEDGSGQSQDIGVVFGH